VALDRYLELLDDAAGYVEYGAGGSSVCASERGVPTISLETDRNYAAAVRGKLGDASSVEVLVADIGGTGAWGIPLHQWPSAKLRKKWMAYPDGPWLHLAAHEIPVPELVLVDGRFRVSSAATSILALAGTEARVFVDDYTTRPNYWALEAVAPIDEIVGIAAIFRPPAKSEKCARALIEEFALDWR
jgi:hypothetical protein